MRDNVRQSSALMKIATFNINNINRRLPHLLAWLDAARPDVVCLQELKAADSQFPEAAIAERGYGAIWQGERTWNGVAILRRGGKPVLTRRGLPGDKSDIQARYIEAAVSGVLIGCIYLPNGNPQPGVKFTYKLTWFQRLIEHASTLVELDAPVVLAGDYNVVPTNFDIYPTKSWAKDALVQPEPRLLPASSGARLDGRPPHAAPGQADVYVLALSAASLGAGRGPATGPPPA